MEGNAFLNYIWGIQPPGWRFLVHRSKAGWFEMPLGMVLPTTKVNLKLPEDGDLYFCPNSFRAEEGGVGKRRKHLALPSRLMYQDLDESDPRELPLQPELWWETSPDRYQAIWTLDQAVEPEELAQLNRALNRACHADPGTWNLTRLLRVPGSWNGKRNCRVSRAYQHMEAVA